METNLHVSLSTLLSPLSPCFASQSFKAACVCVCVQARLCLILCDPMDCSPPGSSVYGISQARVLLWLPFTPPGDHPNPGIEPAEAPTVAYKDMHSRLKEIQDQ